MNNTQRHHDGQFITTGTPSPLMETVMQNILKQQAAEAAQRKAIRECRESTSDFPSWGPAMGQWGNWNISDRH
jgi:hypothetical protein